MSSSQSARLNGEKDFAAVVRRRKSFEREVECPKKKF
jgi:hypothetical protein